MNTKLWIALPLAVIGTVISGLYAVCYAMAKGLTQLHNTDGELF